MTVALALAEGFPASARLLSVSKSDASAVHAPPLTFCLPS